MALAQDRHIIRELAAQCAALAAQEENGERVARMRRNNGLTSGRPIVWLDEVPWHEMDADGTLALRCGDAFARRMEQRLRRILFRWRHFQADMVVEPVYPVMRAYTDSGVGLEKQEDTLALDGKNNIISHRYNDLLETEEQLARLQDPIITALPEEDARNLARAQDLLDGAMPAELRGYPVLHSPWDHICELRGMEPILIDLADRPDFMHRTIERFTEIGLSRMAQMEAQGLLDYRLEAIHCTPPYTGELPAPDYGGGRVRAKDVWFRGAAQIFSSISPAMHQEFDIAYMRRLMDRCGLVYYGCCEPLDGVIPYLKAIPNLRKVGVSPWADVEKCAEQLEGRYVLARKPNPALVAGSFDAEAVRAETTQTVEACLRHGCPYELVLKDISTVGYAPQNLTLWTQTVNEVLDRYY